MKHLSSVVLAAALVAAGVTACFKDPNADLRNGASRLELNRNAITLRTGDSLAIQAELKDDQGNVLNAAAITWSSDNAAVATVRVDSIPIPGPAFSRAFVLAVGAAGGVAHVTATDGNLTSSFRVLVLPARLTASATAAVTGTARTDTIITNPPGGAPILTIFTAGDTVVFTAVSGGALTFRTAAAAALDTANSQVWLGADRAYIVSRTATVLKVVARMPFRGRPWVTRMNWAGPAEVGTVFLDSLQSDSVTVSKPRYYGSVTQLGDTMTINAQAGSTFDAASAVRFGATSAIVLGRTGLTGINVISPITYTGQVTVTAVHVGAATIDSLKSPANYTINQAAFGGTVVTAGALLDTVKVYGTAVTKLDTGSVVTIGGVAAWQQIRYPTTGSTTTLDSVKVFAKVPSSGPVTISRVNVGGNIIPALATAGNIVITETPTGDPDIPAIYSPDAVALPINWATVTAANPYVRYGAVDDAANYDNFFTFTLSATRTVRIQLQFVGTGSAGTAANPDIDLLVCNVGCAAWVSTAGATGAQPENITLTNQAAGTYNILVEGWGTGGTYRPYRLLVW
jgi:hypothetical protein